MANVGLSELIFIFILAFIILGPEELLKVAQTLGLLLKKIRLNYQKLQTELNLKNFNKPDPE